MVTFRLTPTKTYTYIRIYSRSVHSIQYKLFEKFVILLMLCSQSFSKFSLLLRRCKCLPLSLPLNQQQCSVMIRLQRTFVWQTQGSRYFGRIDLARLRYQEKCTEQQESYYCSVNASLEPLSMLKQGHWLVHYT